MRQLLAWVSLSLVMICSAVPPDFRFAPPAHPNKTELDQILCTTYNFPCKGNGPPVQETSNSSPSNTQGGGGNPNPGPSSKQGGGDCQCVKYHQCKSNKSASNSTTDDEIIDFRWKHAKCNGYLEKCCPPEDIQLSPRPPPAVRNHKCGQRNTRGLGFRITNVDGEAQYGEFPWMVAVLRQDSTLHAEAAGLRGYECGGSIIHPQVVLTAAHNVKGKDNLVVVAGEWDTQTQDELYPTQTRHVRQVIVHEQFHSKMGYNDVALLILDKPLDMSMGNVGLICLPEASENMDGRDCVASGWGKDLFGQEGKHQVILKKVDLPVVPWAQCQRALRKTRLGPNFTLHESFMCAGGIPSKDTCTGDGGGPLACPSKKNPAVYVQAGIVSWGIGCKSETPGVYANLPRFVNWLTNKLEALDISID